MTRKEYYEQRSKLRSMRSMVFAGWIEKKTNDKHAIKVLNLIEGEFSRSLVETIIMRTQRKISIREYRIAAWSNSRGTRQVNIKKAGRK